MFEYIIAKSTNSELLNQVSLTAPQIDCPGYKKKRISSGDFVIEVFYRNQESEFLFEDDHSLIILLGTPFWSITEKSATNGKVPVEFFKSIDGEEIQRLRGSFQVLKLDKNTQKLMVFNDIFGLKPCYYGKTDESFLISSSLSNLKTYGFQIDKSSLLEKLIFEHNLGNNTIYKSINTLEEAEYLELETEFSTKQYFNWFEFVNSIIGKEKFSYRNYIRLFNQIIQKRASAEEKNLVTFTGGHDGRAVLSAFLKNNYIVSTFSFGRKGSENTVIPEKISQKLGFEHQSVYLEDEYTENYGRNAYWTSWLSDGELTYNQQTTLYGVSKIAGDYSQVFTGLIAGEILGPVHLQTDYITPAYYKHVYLKEPVDWDEVNNRIRSSFKIDISADIKAEIEERIAKRIAKNDIVLSGKSPHLHSVADMITWGFRKFYAYQMHLMRYYLENFPVFYDFDLIKMLLETNYNKIYQSSYKSLFKRRKSRQIQLYLINKNHKLLAKQPLDRGYTPREAVNVFAFPVKMIKYF
jgi:asparagine synthetase B (glutamine-hydrolysing)